MGDREPLTREVRGRANEYLNPARITGEAGDDRVDLFERPINARYLSPLTEEGFNVHRRFEAETIDQQGSGAARSRNRGGYGQGD